MTTLSQRIAALQTERGQMVRAYETALQPALDDNRDLNDTETATIGEARSRLETIDVQLRHLGEAEVAFQRAAVPAAGALPGNRPGTSMVLATQRSNPVVQMQRRDQFKAADFTRMAIAVSVAGFWNAADYARMRWGDDELCEVIQRSMAMQFRAAVPPMGTNDPPNLGGGLITRFEYLASEFIEMLRPMLIVGRMPSMRRLSFNNAGSLLIPKQTGGVAGGYVGEGAQIAVNRLIFDRMTLVPSKLAVIVPQTQELLRRSDPSTEMLIRDDMLEGTARTVDRHFFSTMAAAANPAGILQGLVPLPEGLIPAPIGPGGADVTAVTLALRAMLWELRRNNVPMNAPVWIMNARTKEYLRLLRTVQEIFAFKAEIDAGTLLGYPIIDTTAIPIPFPPGTGTMTAYALVDASQVIWADDMAPVIDASQEASVQLEDNPPPVPPPPTAPAAQNVFSAFQNDMVFMRLRMSHSWARRHDVAIVWALANDGAPPTGP
jgi:HK97 family phage major capsid protein